MIAAARFQERLQVQKHSLRISIKCRLYYGRFSSSFAAPLAVRCYSHAKVETDEEFDSRWVTYFSKPDLDAWELRKGDSTHCITCSAVNGTRSDVSQDKSGPHEEIYPYVIQELRPTLQELGISTPEELDIYKL
uniref:Cytochrome c oxidase subunit 5A, mitochondrial n=1 Tax=Sinocyclocheilus grahami TaxID=75366 RepID=A0A672NEF3_SINGR